jgi:hypothetical protein
MNMTKRRTKKPGRPPINDGLTTHQRYNEKRRQIMPLISGDDAEAKKYAPIVAALVEQHGSAKAAVLALLDREMQ